MSAMFEFPATLTWDLYARVIDVSASGCLVETRCRLEVGTIGQLRVRLGGVECEDDVEVMRCDAVDGPVASYQVGVRLLWTTPRQPGSIRHAVASQLEARDTSKTPRVMERELLGLTRDN
jgi:PilZ domain